MQGRSSSKTRAVTSYLAEQQPKHSPKAPLPQIIILTWLVKLPTQTTRKPSDSPLSTVRRSPLKLEISSFFLSNSRQEMIAKWWLMTQWRSPWYRKSTNPAVSVICSVSRPLWTSRAKTISCQGFKVSRKATPCPIFQANRVTSWKCTKGKRHSVWALEIYRKKTTGLAVVSQSWSSATYLKANRRRVCCSRGRTRALRSSSPELRPKLSLPKKLWHRRHTRRDASDRIRIYRATFYSVKTITMSLCRTSAVTSMISIGALMLSLVASNNTTTKFQRTRRIDVAAKSRVKVRIMTLRELATTRRLATSILQARHLKRSPALTILHCTKLIASGRQHLRGRKASPPRCPTSDLAITCWAMKLAPAIIWISWPNKRRTQTSSGESSLGSILSALTTKIISKTTHTWAIMKKLALVKTKIKSNFMRAESPRMVAISTMQRLQVSNSDLVTKIMVYRVAWALTMMRSVRSYRNSIAISNNKYHRSS